jgi:hypothetical protein
MPSVARLSLSPVKGLRLYHPDSIEIGLDGILGDRAFYLVDEEGRMANGKLVGELVQVEARLDGGLDRLTLRFPGDGGAGGSGERGGGAGGGTVVEGDGRALGAAVETSFYGRPVTGRVVEGPFAEALSGTAGRAVRLVRADHVSAACDVLHPVSLLSRGSCDELARRSGDPRLADDRRFRMLIVVDGCTAHEEDTWTGRRVRIGDAVVEVAGDVGRCAITGHSPDTGRTDADTLKAISAYRGAPEGRISFGMYADVVAAGRVRVGDPVAPL